jgi:hypothetical protein
LPPSAEHLRARLAAERDKHAERHRMLSMLVSRLNQFHAELRLPPGSVLEVMPVEVIKLKPHERWSPQSRSSGPAHDTRDRFGPLGAAETREPGTGDHRICRLLFGALAAAGFLRREGQSSRDVVRGHDRGEERSAGDDVLGFERGQQAGRERSPA